ncbi:septum formation initiator family protein [Loktanella sp. TSTF-M6]|uniref:Septum formation initiator family protein n=1 Tax=Loktanella gaetbuli TaxID=2881335 RepID=A0ABS8BQ57_9RHOB|nr:septum formation initiator family protein [Loktanella gaetbuli]MCB5197855.1 septum formation initiator family protein [Loktanella gaetbuli]
MTRQKRPAIGTLIYFLGALALGFYFTFAAIQGDYGVLKRSGIGAEGRALEVELEQLRAEVARMENLTMRLSDKYLDLDLLDEQARDVLGLIRTDEMVIR